MEYFEAFEAMNLVVIPAAVEWRSKLASVPVGKQADPLPVAVAAGNDGDETYHLEVLGTR